MSPTLPPRPVVFLYERTVLDPGELEAAGAAGFQLAESVMEVPTGALVLARHTMWPWPRRLQRDLAYRDATLVNGVGAYAYCDSPVSWTYDLAQAGAEPPLTPRLWSRLEDAPATGPFILKGAHADKSRWARMYAATRAEAATLWSELRADTGYRNQDLVLREYVPLRELGDGYGGCPVADEYRVFCYRGVELSRGFYWDPDDATKTAPVGPEAIPHDFLTAARAAIVAGGHVDYYTLDVALRADGGWTVIEVSDGQRAGLSCNDPLGLYENLYKELTQ